MTAMMKTVTVYGEEGMRSLGAALAEGLGAGDAVFLRGEMGMGKSVLARAIARAKGVTEAMPSPSFTILQSYEAGLPVRHFDLYRLEDPAEFYEAGLDEEMGPEALSLVEWPEMADFDPEPRLDIYLSRGAADDIREADIETVGMSGEREAELLSALAEEYE